tara:strand:+ start:3161 stop:3709 length:549 start_codon:yes stop_codon:yes gene_type:complete
MKYKKYWHTPVGQMELDIPDNVRQKLIEAVHYHCKKYKPKSKSLFDYDENSVNVKELQEFEKLSNEIIRYYLTNAYNVVDAKSLNIEAKAFAKYQNHRVETETVTDYYQGFDGVLIYYLDANEKCKHLLFDPRPAITFPTDEKVSIYNPKTGTVLIHPSFLWYDTKSFVGKSIIINYRVLTT